MQIRQGELWQAVTKTTEQAIRAGALVPIPTGYQFIEDQGVRFFVRVLAALARKDEERKAREAAGAAGRPVNPFLPPEQELTVAEVSDTHIAILNKYNVMERHLLLVTREFEDQEMLLTQRDFAALAQCMAEYDSLGFYNGGAEAGASQKHKHLQLVPLPLAPEGPRIPIDPLIAGVADSDITRLPGFSFRHAFVRLTGGPVSETLFRVYGELLQSLGMTGPPHHGLLRQSQPYCLLVTRSWMLVVPRSSEHFEDISLNSLAFAGSLFVRNEQQLERLAAYGPLRALADVVG